jgi:hypothetical protein
MKRYSFIDSIVGHTKETSQLRFAHKCSGMILNMDTDGNDLLNITFLKYG